MILSIGEVFEKLELAKTFEEKKEIILKHNTPALRTYLRIAFDGSVTMLLPEGLPEMKFVNVPQGLGETSLLSEAKKMYLFLAVDGKPAHPTLTAKKRENIFLGLLTALDNVEREYLKQLKEKSVDVGLSFKDINKIIPGLLQKENEKGKKLGNDSGDSLELESKDENLNSTPTPTEQVAVEVKEDKPKKPKRTRKTKAQKQAELKE
jgi:hypothetical protein